MSSIVMGVCPECQTECCVSDDKKFCLPHDVFCGKPDFGPCKGSFNTGPECTWEYETESFKTDLQSMKEFCGGDDDDHHHLL